ncbi:MAG: hypothetical protein GX649_16805, partial [Chloroflexi bacterium]|nr:hypothetical protein [Chloroflexota bacterium]
MPLVRRALALAVVLGLLVAPQGARSGPIAVAVGEQANGFACRCSISDDGRYVVFESEATNLVPNDTNDERDVFVRDRQEGRTVRVSVSSTGEQSNGFSHAAQITGDGRYVAFSSGGSNLVPGDANGYGDVFVYDLASGETERVSLIGGAEMDGSASLEDISSDGRYVLFSAYYGTAAGGCPWNGPCYYVHDRSTHETFSIGTPAAVDYDVYSIHAYSIADDGNRIMMTITEDDPDYYIDELHGPRRTYRYNRVTEALVLLPRHVTEYGDIGSPGVSRDGRYVAYTTYHVFSDWEDKVGHIYDFDAAEDEEIALDSAGVALPGYSDHVALSADAKSVAFRYTTQVVDLPIEVPAGVYVRDRESGELAWLTEPFDGVTDREGFLVTDICISGDGRYVGFSHRADNLLPSDTNGFTDVFLYDRTTGTREIVSLADSPDQPTPAPTPLPTAAPGEVIVDDADPGFSAVHVQDPWQVWSGLDAPHYGASHRYNRENGAGGDVATWRFDVPSSGLYDVYAWWWATENRPTDAPYTIHHLTGEATVRVNQQADGGQWNLLGRYPFSGEGAVSVSDAATTGRNLAADAVRLVRAGDLPSSTATPVTPTKT